MPKQLTQSQQQEFKGCYDQWTKGRKSLGDCEIKWRTKVLPALGKAFINESGYEGLLTVDYIKGLCEAWRIYHQKKGTESGYIMRMETWLNKNGWLNSVPAHTELKQSKADKGIHHCSQCDNTVKIRFTLCKTCTDNYIKNLGPKNHCAFSTEDRKKWFLEQGIYKEGMTKTEAMQAFSKSRKQSLSKLRARLK